MVELKLGFRTLTQYVVFVFDQIWAEFFNYSTSTILNTDPESLKVNQLFWSATEIFIYNFLAHFQNVIYMTLTKTRLYE